MARRPVEHVLKEQTRRVEEADVLDALYAMARR